MKKTLIYFTLFILITLMNKAHSILYVIHDEGLNDSVLFTLDEPYDLVIVNRYPGHDIEALAAHPQNEELLVAASGDNTDKPGYLYQVNPQTGKLTEIGSTGFAEIEGLSFKADGTLWAWAKGKGLIKVDIQTGAGKLIFPSKIKMEDITWKDDEVLYLAQGTDLWKYDGQGLERACDLSTYTEGKHIEALEMMADNSLLVGMHGQRTLLKLSVMSLNPCFILNGPDIPTEHSDIEGIAYSKFRPITLWKPRIAVADSLKPGIPKDVGFAIKVSGGTGNIPPLYLEEVTPQGQVKLGQLYDNGINWDAQANDYLYSGKFSVQKMAEGEYCYRVRSGENISAMSCLWVVSFPMPISTVSSQEESVLVESVLVIFTDETSLSRIKEIVLAEGATVLGSIPVLNLLQIPVEAGTLQKVVARFEKYHEVKSAKPNILYPAPEPLVTLPPDNPVLSEPQEVKFPNDPEFLRQNSLKQIRANEAWYIARGNIPVAVIDTGVDANHPDLAGKVVDGWNFEEDNENTDDVASYYEKAKRWDDELGQEISYYIKKYKPHGHGTAVASVIGAVSNNGIGMASVSWDSQIRPFRARSTKPKLDAFLSLVESPPPIIINLSQNLAVFEYEEQFQAVVKQLEQNDALLVNSAGNDGANEVSSFCSIPSVFCVGGVTGSDEVHQSSNFHSSVGLFAPYNAITASILPNYGYAPNSGTSFSAPLVSGAASVLWSLHPDWKARQVRKHLVDTAKPLDWMIRQENVYEQFLKGLPENWYPPTGQTPCQSAFQLGDVEAYEENEIFLLCKTGESHELTTVRVELDIPKGVEQLSIYFKYNYISQEYNGSDDALTISIHRNPENVVEILKVDNTSLKEDIIQGPEWEGHFSAKQTGWLWYYKHHDKTSSPTFPLFFEGKAYMDITMTNRGNSKRYPFLLLDNFSINFIRKVKVPPGTRRLDIFEAVFGGSFETSLEQTGWTVKENCSVQNTFGQFMPTDRTHLMVCGTYPNGKTAWISRELDIQEGVTLLPISLDYNFLSQEYPKLKDAPVSDTIRLKVLSADGTITQLEANVGNIPMFEDTLRLPGGDIAIGQTGWQTVTAEIPVTPGKGEIAVMMISENDPELGGDGDGNNLHSALLVDNIRFVIDDEPEKE